MKKTLRANEIAEMLGVTKASVLRWLRNGHGPTPISTPGRLYLFDPDEVEDWITEMKNIPARYPRKTGSGSLTGR